MCKKTITIEKEVYEAVLRNSVKVADLEAENMQLRQFCEGFNALNVAEENQKLKELLKDSRFMLREMANVNNWFEGDDCEPNYYMATECEKYADKIDEVLR